jgi:hypothetical protein
MYVLIFCDRFPFVVLYAFAVTKATVADLTMHFLMI